MGQADHGDLGPVACPAAFRSHLRALCALVGVGVLLAVAAWLCPAGLRRLAGMLAFGLVAAAAVAWERQRQLLHDGLTGLPNRILLGQRGRVLLAEAERQGGRVALFLLDLDRFREVNDTLGYATGDRLLRLVADRLASAVRPEDTVARLGGDEFAVLLPLAPDAGTAQETAEEIAGRVVYGCAEPFQVDGIMLDLEVSVGVALYPDHGSDFETLLRRADVAMYQAKSFRGGVEVYAVERDRNTPERLSLLGDLRRALEAREVELHYQPKVAFGNGVVIGFEALLRWRHVTRGALAPDEFIELAEQTGLMSRLTEYVIDSALAQAARWWRFGLTVPVAVNVSLRDIRSPEFVATISAKLRRYGVPPSALELEITERVLLSGQQRAAETLVRLDGLGVRLSLDDFGTGYSSLVHLRRLPVSEIKIDRSFVAQLADDENDAAIVRSTVDLAHALGIQVVAEGVENEKTWERLGQLGCDAAQGWLLAEALPADEATAWMERHAPCRWTARPAAEPGG